MIFSLKSQLFFSFIVSVSSFLVFFFLHWYFFLVVFVRDGILSVADYNSTLMGVVVVVVYLFHNGIT